MPFGSLAPDTPADYNYLLRSAQRGVEADEPASFGALAASQPLGYWGAIKALGQHLLGIPQAAYQASEAYRTGGEYDPGPVMEAAGFGLTGGLPGVTARAGETVLGAGPVRGIRAYHGSPYDFDRFDISKVGTGEGAQSYGHGLYFAENEGVARQYRDNLSVTPKVNSYNWNPDGTPNRAGQVASELDAQISEGDIRTALRVKEPNASSDQIDKWIEDGRKLYADARKAGRMYEVNINAQPEQFLDWDKPLAEQPTLLPSLSALGARDVDPALVRQLDEISKAIAQVEQQPDSPTKAARLANLRDSMRAAREYFPSPGREVIGSLGGGPRASQALSEAGIPGIRYLDQLSRQAGEGSRNYVVFDPAIVDIIRKYGLAGAAALPAVGVAAGGGAPQSSFGSLSQ